MNRLDMIRIMAALLFPQYRDTGLAAAVALQLYDQVSVVNNDFLNQTGPFARTGEKP